MINYNTLQRVEEDTDKCGNYITVQYEFPFPDSPTHLIDTNEGRYVDFIDNKIYLNDKKMRRIWKKHNNKELLNSLFTSESEC